MSLNRQQTEDLIDEIELGASFFTQLAFHSEALLLWIKRNPSINELIEVYREGYVKASASLSTDETLVYENLVRDLCSCSIANEHQVELGHLHPNEIRSQLHAFLCTHSQLAIYIYDNIYLLRPVFTAWNKDAKYYCDYFLAQYDYQSLHQKLLSKLGASRANAYTFEEVVRISLGDIQHAISILRKARKQTQKVAELTSNFKCYAQIQVHLDMLERYIQSYNVIARFENKDANTTLVESFAMTMQLFQKKRDDSLNHLNDVIFLIALYKYIMNTNWNDAPNSEVPKPVLQQIEMVYEFKTRKLSATEARSKVMQIGETAYRNPEVHPHTKNYFRLFDKGFVQPLEAAINMVRQEIPSPKLKVRA